MKVNAGIWAMAILGTPCQQRARTTMGASPMYTQNASTAQPAPGQSTQTATDVADVLIIGAGPAGLCLARALSGQGLKITVIEQQAEAGISDPAFDGREIALTQHSAAVMKSLDLWDRIEPHSKAQLRDARIIDGESPFAMVIGHQLAKHTELGWLVSNHLIRKAAFESVQHAKQQHGDITLLAGEKLTDIHATPTRASIKLASGKSLHASLVVAADSRFSVTRRMMGIAAEMHDFGKNMVVCCMTHEGPHDFAAWEWFDYGQTLALLPMNPDPATGMHRSSVVITLPSQESDQLMHMASDEFNQNVARRFKNRLGAMALVSSRHVYPLVSVFPNRMVSTRFATVGDAAVGMHPVTAHGFNFGLLSVEALAKEVIAAHQRQADIASSELLYRFESTHRRATRPLYMMTRLVIEIYTRESPPAKLARKLILRLGDKLTPFKKSIALSLAGT
jgi:ubiquinone biosynthesis UbiH/UbiF/VisC/COQ6 family hydroxylase